MAEVLVSIAVFSIITVTMISTFTGLRRAVVRQEQYLRFEMMCRDIAFYGDEYGKDWAVYCFPSAVEVRSEDGRIYFDADYTPNAIGGKYLMTYRYNAGDELVISVYEINPDAPDDITRGKVIIDNLNYGGGRYV